VPDIVVGSVVAVGAADGSGGVVDGSIVVELGGAALGACLASRVGVLGTSSGDDEGIFNPTGEHALNNTNSVRATRHMTLNLFFTLSPLFFKKLTYNLTLFIASSDNPSLGKEHIHRYSI
jgi:hypothetical protein